MKKLVLALGLLVSMNAQSKEIKPLKFVTIYEKYQSRIKIKIDGELWKFRFTNKEYDNEQLVQMSMWNDEKKRTYRNHSTFKNLHIAIDSEELHFTKEEVFVMYWFKYTNGFDEIVREMISRQLPHLNTDRLDTLTTSTIQYLQLFID